MDAVNATPLNRVTEGTYRITEMCGPAASRRLHALGILKGDIIRVISAGPGPVIFLKGNTRLGMGRGMARDILVVPATEGMPGE